MVVKEAAPNGEATKQPPQANPKRTVATSNQRLVSEELPESYNSRYMFSLNANQKKVVEAVQIASEPITPREIASRVKLNHSTVRVLVRELKKRGFLTQKTYGLYSTPSNSLTLDSREGVGGSVRVHGLRLGFGRVGTFVRRWGVVVGGVARVSFQVYGDGSALVFVDCLGSNSFDAVGLRLLLDVVCRELRVSVEDGWACDVSSYELNSDLKGVRLDGVQCITLRAFDGAFFRAYNKGAVVRSEVKATRPLQLENVLALMNGGVSAYNLAQLLFLKIQKEEEMRDSQKLTNRILMDILGQNRRLISALEGSR